MADNLFKIKLKNINISILNFFYKLQNIQAQNYINAKTPAFLKAGVFIIFLK